MVESHVFDEKLFETFVQKGKVFGLQEKDLIEYVQKNHTGSGKTG